MTLVLEAMPSAGGPRSFFSRAGRVLSLAVLLSSAFVLLVMSVSGRTSSVAASGAAASSVAASSFPPSCTLN